MTCCVCRRHKLPQSRIIRRSVSRVQTSSLNAPPVSRSPHDTVRRGTCLLCACSCVSVMITSSAIAIAGSSAVLLLSASELPVADSVEPTQLVTLAR
jgi:hypothetical protein